MNAPRPRAQAWTALKLALAILLLLVTLRLLHAKVPLAALTDIDVGWLALGVAAGTVAQLAAAGRWYFTAKRMNAAIGLRFAIAECYAASLLNQTLLFGVGGDAVRIARHGASLGATTKDYALALRTHLVERAAGQITLILFALWAGFSWSTRPALTLGIAGTVIVAALALAVHWRRRFARESKLLAWVDEAYGALIDRSAWLTQLALSSLIVVACLAAYLCAARALHVPLSLRDVLRIGPIVLAAMTLPIGVGGFGPREAASAALFSASAFDAGRGTLVGLVYGGLSVLTTLPAIPLWLLRFGPPPSVSKHR